MWTLQQNPATDVIVCLRDILLCWEYSVPSYLINAFVYVICCIMRSMTPSMDIKEVTIDLEGTTIANLGSLQVAKCVHIPYCNSITYVLLLHIYAVFL